MKIVSNQIDEEGLAHTILVRDQDEDLLAFDTNGFYRIGPCILSGHDVGAMQRVTWCPVTQQWKDQA